MSGTRNLFDALMKKYQLLKDDIKTNPRHVHNSDFKHGIVKIQMSKEVRLTDDEKETVQVLLIEESDRDVEGRELSFIKSVLLEAETQQKKRA